MVIKFRTITDPGTPEEKVEDKTIIDVHLDDRSSVPAISYRWDGIPSGWNTWDRIGDTWLSLRCYSIVYIRKSCYRR